MMNHLIYSNIEIENLNNVNSIMIGKQDDPIIGKSTGMPSSSSSTTSKYMSSDDYSVQSNHGIMLLPQTLSSSSHHSSHLNQHMQPQSQHVQSNRFSTYDSNEPYINSNNNSNTYSSLFNASNHQSNLSYAFSNQHSPYQYQYQNQQTLNSNTNSSGIYPSSQLNSLSVSESPSSISSTTSSSSSSQLNLFKPNDLMSYMATDIIGNSQQHNTNYFTETKSANISQNQRTNSLGSLSPNYGKFNGTDSLLLVNQTIMSESTNTNSKPTINVQQPNTNSINETLEINEPNHLSSNSSTSSSSASSTNSNNCGVGGSNSKPPVIYAWMKKVHLNNSSN
jgi:hypothetical protein